MVIFPPTHLWNKDRKFSNADAAHVTLTLESAFLITMGKILPRDWKHNHKFFFSMFLSELPETQQMWRTEATF